MRKIWAIARREYSATVRTKAFVIGVVMMPVMMGGSSAVAILSKRMDDNSERKFAVIDRSPKEKALPMLEAAVDRRNREDAIDPKTGARTSPTFRLERIEPSEYTPAAVDQQRLEQSERVRKGEISGLLEIGPKVFSDDKSILSVIARGLAQASKKPENEGEFDRARDPGLVRFQCKPTATGAQEFYRWSMIEILLASAYGEKGSDPNFRKAMMNQRPPVVLLGLSSKTASGEIVDDEGATKSIVGFFVALGCVMMMFMLIMVVATPLMQGVLEEKMQRISEVLLGSVKPHELMAGKLIGGVGVAMTLSVIYLGGALWAANRYGMTDQVPPSLVAWFCFYLLLSLVMYGSIFTAIGAACTDMKEPQALMTPVMLVIMLPMFALAPILKEPDGAVARMASFFPPSTPMIMVARQSLSANILWWEPILGLLLVGAFTTFCVWAAGRIFRVGILMQGKGAKFGEMMHWVFKA